MATSGIDTVPLWIGGKEESASSTFSVVDPATGEPCWEAASASVEDAIRATAAAEAVFPAWSATKPMARQAILLKAASLMEERADELVSLMTREMGVDYPVGRYVILSFAINMMRDIAGRIPTICGTVPVVQRDGQSAMIWKEPYGVILGVVPW